MKNSIQNFTEAVEDINAMISILLEQSDSEKKKDVEDIRKEISDLRKLIQSKNSGQSLGFSKIRIRFDGEYELKLPKYGLETFNRNLKGEMYFSVLGGTDEYMDIKTSSFPDTFKIRLDYQTLDVYKNQVGDAYLIYNRGTEKLVGEEIKVKYKIIIKS
jgi:hypothetical protein